MALSEDEYRRPELCNVVEPSEAVPGNYRLPTTDYRLPTTDFRHLTSISRR
ncbi:hypothetical protein [Syntrophaceticus schinkii]|uniref:hypothetical protein n=1 Tax=Syntrophaceticus schinkii TaxID=499207 RepID=UPI0018DC059D|nr:hypothetical protein [Syntrophaceticus schinkii]